LGIILHLLNIYLERMKDDIESHIKSETKTSLISNESFPPTDWLSGKDIMGKYNISGYELYQHIEAGLPIYDENTDIYFKGTNPMELEEMWFRLAANKAEFIEHDLLNMLFKRKDIEDYLKQSGGKPNKANSADAKSRAAD